MAKVISQKRFMTEALEAHNKYRELHNVPPLELDSRLNNMALEWAEHLAETGSFKYRNSSLNKEPIGESISRSKTSYLSGDQLTEEWYKEEAFYNYDGQFSPDIGHFSQIIWKNTTKVGFGFASTEDGTFYAVANYYPAGNYRNEFHLNVLKPKNSNILSDILTSINKKIEINKPSSKIEQSTSKYIPANRTLDYSEPKNNRSTETTNSAKKANFDNIQSRFINEALDAHNSYRRRHGADPLTHNPDLSKIAQDYANYLASIGSLKHSTNTYNNKKLGENLAFSYDSRADYYSGDSATTEWYNEIKMHRFQDYQQGTGHFTQVVWKNSKEVGFGLAKARDGGFYAVANYYPPGNYIGQFNQNVSRPLY